MKNTVKKLSAFVLALLLGILLSAAEASAASVGRVKALEVYHRDDDEVNVRWNAVKGADGYTVYLQTANGWRSQGSTRRTSFEVDDLRSAAKNKIKVRAYKLRSGKKVYGSYSSVITAVTEPDEVENLRVSKKTIKTVTLTWSKVRNATRYQVYVYDSAKGKYVRKATVKGTKATIKNLKGGTAYKFKVRAYYKPGKKNYYGDFSDTLSVKTKTKASSSSSSSNSSLITSSKATSLALSHAKLSKSKVYDLESKLDRENGVQVYEVEFGYKGYDYEYEINAKTGKIIHVEKSRDD